MVADGNLNQEEFSDSNSPLAKIVERYYAFKEMMADIEFIGNIFLYKAAKAPNKFIDKCREQLLPKDRLKDIIKSSEEYFGE